MPLDFTDPTTGATAAALDGNAPANRTVFPSTSLTPAQALAPGDNIWLRWEDVNDTGNDHGLAINDFSVSASAPVPFELCPGLGTLVLVAWGAIVYRKSLQKCKFFGSAVSKE